MTAKGQGKVSRPTERGGRVPRKAVESTLMDPNELIKHAPELLKGGAAVAGALKFTDVIKAMLGDNSKLTSQIRCNGVVPFR